MEGWTQKSRVYHEIRLRIMENQHSLTTNRLTLSPLTLSDSTFILALLNTDGWKQFIGTRLVTTLEEAIAYIERIACNANTIYWVVRLKPNETPIGLVTFIKRDYLPHADIGFALLPQYTGKGYAYEATNAVLKQVVGNGETTLQAITVPENVRSISLLKKLGFAFEREIEENGEKLQVFLFNT